MEIRGGGEAGVRGAIAVQARQGGMFFAANRSEISTHQYLAIREWRQAVDRSAVVFVEHENWRVEALIYAAVAVQAR